MELFFYNHQLLTTSEKTTIIDSWQRLQYASGYHHQIHKQSTSTISNTRYIKLSLSRTLGLSALWVTSLINLFGISNLAFSNFHYVELFSPSLQRFLRIYLKPFHFNNSNFERIHLETLIQYLSLLISTQHVGQTKVQ